MDGQLATSVIHALSSLAGLVSFQGALGDVPKHPSSFKAEGLAGGASDEQVDGRFLELLFIIDFCHIPEIRHLGIAVLKDLAGEVLNL